MTRRSHLLLPVLFCLGVFPALSQTTAIGGGACNSSVLNGTYELLLSGRQVLANGAVSKVFQADGTATFDGLSKVTFTMTANTVTSSQSFGTPLIYSGTYSVQSNCVGSIAISTGDTATFSLEALSISSTTGLSSSFVLTGSDATYAYNGTGNSQPATCPATLSGAFQFTLTGSSLSGPSVSGVLDLVGLLQFDGQGNLTASAVSAAGTYSIGSTCLGSATLTDTANNKYSLSMSIYTTGPDLAVAMTSPQAILDGSATPAQPATGSVCSASMLNGTYETILGGRLVPSGVTTRFLYANGAATFDGVNKVTLSETADAVNGSQSFGTPLTFSGTYTLQPNCQGSINITTGDTVTFALVAYSLDATIGKAKSFAMVGSDATYAYNGSGTVQPDLCSDATLSGPWVITTNGSTLSGSTITGAVDIIGDMNFDGEGNATASWTQFSNTATTTVSATGTYSIGAACLGSLTLSDTSGNKYAGTFSIYGANGAGAQLTLASPQVAVSGAVHAPFSNPGLAVVNASSFTAGQTPPGAWFSVFGAGLATKDWQASSVPFPTTALNTTVSVNGELAPLWYASSGQVNAQMPEDTKPGLATVIVKNGSATSNAVAVAVPATGTPGIVVWGNNRADVSNQDGSTNSPSSQAAVGDIVTVWFNGGGPVNSPAPLVTGSPAPSGLSWVTGTYSVTVGGVDATVKYIGLSPGSVGLYQANIVVPKVAAGDRAVVITIAGQASNDPLLAVAK